MQLVCMFHVYIQKSTYTCRDGGCDPFFTVSVRDEEDHEEYVMFRSRDYYKPLHIRRETFVDLPVGPSQVCALAPKLRHLW